MWARKIVVFWVEDWYSKTGETGRMHPTVVVVMMEAPPPAPVQVQILVLMAARWVLRLAQVGKRKIVALELAARLGS